MQKIPENATIMLNSLRKFLYFFILLFTLNGCGVGDITDQHSQNQDCIKTGYNINWSFLPELNSSIINAAASLNPDIIRYPGGSVSKTWNWEEGTTSKSPNRTAHPLDDLLALKEATGADVIFVLNTISKTLDNQLEMLRTAQSMGIPIKYIEMGNEHYLGKGNNADDAGNHQDNVKAFPTGKEYAEFVNQWAPAIRDEFPDAKIGITMLGRSNPNQRLRNWNRLIVDNINPDSFDAYIYHIYVRPKHHIKVNQDTIPEIIKQRTDDLQAVMINDKSKAIWITEYGVHADTIENTVALTSALADYIDSMASIGLPQVLYTKSNRTFFSLLQPPNADSLTELGAMFYKRAHRKD